MADCRKYKEMISAYADGELSSYDEIELQRHLEECAPCRSLLSLYKSITGAAADILVEPPESFTENVMNKIKAMPKSEEAIKPTTKKPKKSLRPVIISFVAAAACLTLAFIASPALFGLGMSNTASTMPMASASAAYGAETQEAALDYSSDAVAKSAENGDTGTAVEDGAGTASEAPMTITAASEMPQPTASEAPSLTASGRDDEAKLQDYYAIIYVEGQLPDVLNNESMINNTDGTFSMEIAVETANRLIADAADLKVEMGAPDMTKALVIYTPAK